MEEGFDKRRAPVLGDDNGLKLGIFGTNLRGGVTLAEFDGNIEATWAETLRYAQIADRLDLEAVIPVARWRGYGGDHNLGERSFETFTWTTGLLAGTRRIQVFATCHVPIWHPVVVAKMAATADHVSGGRFGLNIVAGWSQAELGMFGVTLAEHDARYEAADEWAQVLERLWTADERFDWHGEHYDVPGAFSDPKPLQRPWPTIMNAGTSGAGRAFAVKHSDLIFAGLTAIDRAQAQIDEIKAQARDAGREDFAIFGRAHILIRDSAEEARAEFERIHWADADVAGARNVTNIVSANSGSTPFDEMKEKQTLQGMIAGFWALPLVGTADDVAQGLIDLHARGLDGVALSWPYFDEGLRQLEEQILPRLIDAGIRRPIPALAPVA
ncbi:MAG TPA: LLM class flavin-dependent oxidoreductase [Solirubrobacteraceae bacterium]|nr:LLM class flavin-dependent oxidoreductase [Solirubrobacteraceae bacterium]